MKRALIIAAVAVFVVGGAFVSLGASSPEGKTYKIVFDNAFGLVTGADFKVGGVAVGSIEKLDVTRDARAVITVRASKGGDGFAGLRDSATCQINPQSLIGEYFIDCQPGKSGELLASGATIPVEKTSSPIPPDLVLNIMREPVAQRFSIIFSELGAGFAARGDDVNETIRRAIPALQSTDAVLEQLAANNRMLASLARESGQVLKVLGERRRDVGDFVLAARDASAATAERGAELSETFRRFPGFLDQLTPTMTDLGTAARLQTPALADLRAAAPTVTGLLRTLRPFSRASLPAVTTLGDAGQAGRTAARAASPLVERLGDLGEASGEPARNLRIILDHLDDRDNAVEPNPTSPGNGAGYTGLEAPLQYIYNQSLAINTFDQRGYSLKLNLNLDECSGYTTVEDISESGERYARCNQNLGPNQPGINQPDPSTSDARFALDPQRSRAQRRGTATLPEALGTPATPGATPAPDQTAAPTAPAVPPAATPGIALPPGLGLKPLQDLLNQVTAPVTKLTDPRDGQALLDFLLRP